MAHFCEWEMEILPSVAARIHGNKVLHSMCLNVNRFNVKFDKNKKPYLCSLFLVYAIPVTGQNGYWASSGIRSLASHLQP